MTERQRNIRELGLQRAREMNREYAVTQAQRRQTQTFLVVALITLFIATIQTLLMFI